MSVCSQKFQFSVMLMVLVLCEGASAQTAQDACAVVKSGVSAVVQRAVADMEKINSKCFDPQKDPDIQKYYYHNSIQSKTCDLHETKYGMKRMHQTIYEKSKLYGMDPRIVYIRMLGESQGNPFAQYGENGNHCPKINEITVSSTKAFGLFQFLGSGYKMQKSFAQELLEKMKANENLPANTRKGVREVQVDYYFDHYVEKYSNSAKYTKCKKEFKSFSNIEKLAYLGRGDCTSTKKSLETIMDNKSYIATGAKRIFQEMEKGIPLCVIK